MSKLDADTFGWALREVYNNHLREGMKEYTGKLREALEEDDASDIIIYGRLLKENAEQFKTVSELDSYGFLIEVYKAMHTVWEEHLKYLREEQPEKMQKKAPS